MIAVPARNLYTQLIAVSLMLRKLTEVSDYEATWMSLVKNPRRANHGQGLTQSLVSAGGQN